MTSVHGINFGSTSTEPSKVSEWQAGQVLTQNRLNATVKALNQVIEQSRGNEQVSNKSNGDPILYLSSSKSNYTSKTVSAKRVFYEPSDTESEYNQSEIEPYNNMDVIGDESRGATEKFIKLPFNAYPNSTPMIPVRVNQNREAMLPILCPGSDADSINEPFGSDINRENHGEDVYDDDGWNRDPLERDGEDKNKDGVEIAICTGVVYDHAGDKKLYGYGRILSFDSNGCLVKFGKEQRYEIDAAEDCTA